jgi:O-antigen/teichoic acid export membrane protein
MDPAAETGLYIVLKPASLNRRCGKVESLLLSAEPSLSSPGIRILKDILHVGFPKLVSGSATILIAIASMRFLDPASYGMLSLGLSCLALFDALAGSALDLGTTRLITGGSPCGPRIEPAEKAAVWLKLACGAALLAIFAAAGEWLGSRLFHRGGGRSFFAILTAAATAILLLRSAQLYYQARLRFRPYGVSDFAHGVLRLLSAGLILLKGWASPSSILACFAVAPAVVIVALFRHGRAAAGWRTVRATRLDYVALLRSSVPVLATFTVTSLVSRFDLLFVAMRTGPAQLGLYGGALMLATIPEILGAYLAPVFLPRILPACRDGSFPDLFRRLHLRIYAACGPMLIAVLLVGRPVLSRLLPVSYSVTVDLVLILIPGTLAVASFFPLTLNFLMLKQPGFFLIFDLAAAPILAASYYFLAPVHGAIAVAWITCLYRLVKAATAQSVAYRLVRQGG